MEPDYQSPLPPATPPKNWLAEAILVTIFCCLPLGIVSIVNAAQVNSRFRNGDYEGALRASKEAGKWTKIALYVTIGAWLLYILAMVLFGVSAFWSSDEFDY